MEEQRARQQADTGATNPGEGGQETPAAGGQAAAAGGIHFSMVFESDTYYLYFGFLCLRYGLLV